jgi:hypothetical protein
MESISFYRTDGGQRSVGWSWTNFHWSCTRMHIHTHKFVLVEWGWELRTKLSIWYATLMTYYFSTTNILSLYHYTQKCAPYSSNPTQRQQIAMHHNGVLQTIPEREALVRQQPHSCSNLCHTLQKEDWSDKGIAVILQLYGIVWSSHPKRFS